ADDRAELPEGVLVAPLGADVVPGHEQVAGVEADAEPRRAAEQVDDLGEVLEAMPEVRALASGVLEQDPRAAAGSRRQDLGKAVGNQPQSARLGPRRVGARVHYQAIESERLGAIELVAERVDRSPAQRRIGGGEVDQVAVVRDDGADLRLPDAPLEQRDFLWRQVPRAPLAG